MKSKWWIGCSGFHYKHWKEIFYPADLPQKKWFDFYLKYFNTLELNVTFYRFPRLNVLLDWYAKTPDEFKFSVKMNKAITHYKQFNGTERMIGDFYATCREGLQEKLGPILFQMPPRTHYTEERLDKIVNSLDPSFNNVLEFRHTSWWDTEVFAKLRKLNITFCGMSHPDYQEEVIINTPEVYYRFHGVPNLYQSKYWLPKLRSIANQVRDDDSVKTAYFYFNNDIDGSAVVNAQQLKRYYEKLKAGK